jgi:formate/nitrite transporter FocA (FNT family)
MDWFGHQRRQEAIRRWAQQIATQSKLEHAHYSPWAIPAAWTAGLTFTIGTLLVLMGTPGPRGRPAVLPLEHAWVGAILFAVGLSIGLIVRRFGVRVTRVIDELEE